MEINVDFIQSALTTGAGLSVAIVMLTQVFKNWFNKSGNRVVSQLLSFLASFILNAVVLLIGLQWNFGLYSEFIVSDVWSWIYMSVFTIGCALIANGAWSYSFVQSILEWIKLLPKNK